MKVLGYAASSSYSKLKPFEFERKDAKENEVEIDVEFCGVCHSDIHQARNEWHNTNYPCMPGHEIAGRVTKVGSAVTKFKEGDLVGVGCMVNSCQQCKNCLNGQENFCEYGFTATYNGNQRDPKKDANTLGGYSTKMVVREDFVLKIPEGMNAAVAAPILCAGVTTYSPLKRWGVKQGTKVGIIGLGGLGHMATKIAVAMGAEVTIISSSADKKEDALKLGAKNFVDETDKESMKSAEGTLELILNTIPESHDVNPYFALLQTDGILTIVGCLVPLKKALDLSKIMLDRKTLATSLIGNLEETQEVLDFCAKHGIGPDIKIIDIAEINDAYDKVNDKKADFRYVIDMNTLKVKHEETILEKMGLSSPEVKA